MLLRPPRKPARANWFEPPLWSRVHRESSAWPWPISSTGWSGRWHAGPRQHCHASTGGSSTWLQERGPAEALTHERCVASPGRPSRWTGTLPLPTTLPATRWSIWATGPQRRLRRNGLSGSTHAGRRARRAGPRWASPACCLATLRRASPASAAHALETRSCRVRMLGRRCSGGAARGRRSPALGPRLSALADHGCVAAEVAAAGPGVLPGCPAFRGGPGRGADLRRCWPGCHPDGTSACLIGSAGCPGAGARSH